jgi:hypothetical protein
MPAIREDSSPTTVVDLLDRIFFRAGHSWPVLLRYLTLVLVPLAGIAGCVALLLWLLPVEAVAAVPAVGSVATAALAAWRRRSR